ncbi:MAG: hypothetical protein IKS98_15200, partial [Lachnospiraceae bacterium]|nr:hypothetical protein [Lachnospiraceae bacterium]
SKTPKGSKAPTGAKPAKASDLASGSIPVKKPLASEAVPIKQPSSSKPFNEHTFDKNLYMNDGKESFPFRDHLIDLLNKKNIDNIVAYKSSNIDRKAFAKILSGDTKNPQKRTVLAFCVGLKLSLEESQELLASADLAFNPYDKRDKLVRDCILSGQYDVGQVNEMLYACKQVQLGSFFKD